MSTSQGDGKCSEDNVVISEGIYYLKLFIKVLEADMGAKCSFSTEGDSHVFVEIFSVLIVCVTRSQYRLLLGSGRFRAPISSDECRRFEDSWVSDASRRKLNWVLNVFEEWRETRNEAVLKVEHSGKPVLNQRIDELSDEDLGFFLGSICG